MSGLHLVCTRLQGLNHKGVSKFLFKSVIGVKVNDIQSEFEITHFHLSKATPHQTVRAKRTLFTVLLVKNGNEEQIVDKAA